MRFSINLGSEWDTLLFELVPRAIRNQFKEDKKMDVIRDPLNAEKMDMGDKVKKFFSDVVEGLYEFAENVFIPMLLGVAREVGPVLLTAGRNAVVAVAAREITGDDADRERAHAAQDIFHEELKAAGVTASASAANFIIEYMVSKIKREAGK